jgi:SpoU rRNA methylase family enzyme
MWRVIVVPPFSGALTLLKPDYMFRIFHMSIAEYCVLAVIMARGQFGQQINGEEVVQVVVFTAEPGFAIRHLEHVARRAYLGFR